ncbi:MAG: hypothetical protein GDA53_10425 [Rhodobacteraceae bacterium]|nr:hypothetical protein [Paracoccaceae bacterium]
MRRTQIKTLSNTIAFVLEMFNAGYGLIAFLALIVSFTALRLSTRRPDIFPSIDIMYGFVVCFSIKNTCNGWANKVKLKVRFLKENEEEIDYNTIYGDLKCYIDKIKHLDEAGTMHPGQEIKRILGGHVDLGELVEKNRVSKIEVVIKYGLFRRFFPNKKYVDMAILLGQPLETPPEERLVKAINHLAKKIDRFPKP